jgi:flagellar biosynthesis/type III secretory pathway protein FliH
MKADRALKKISREREHWARTLFREKAAMDYRSGMYNAHQRGLEEGTEKARLMLEEKDRAIEEKDRVIEELKRKLREAGKDAY